MPEEMDTLKNRISDLPNIWDPITLDDLGAYYIGLYKDAVDRNASDSQQIGAIEAESLRLSSYFSDLYEKYLYDTMTGVNGVTKKYIELLKRAKDDALRRYQYLLMGVYRRRQSEVHAGPAAGQR